MFEHGKRMIRIGLLLLLAVLAVAGCDRKTGSPGDAEETPKPSPPGPPPEGMVLVPGGRYTIGSESGDPDERPPHEVVLDPFYVDAREVTNAEFARFVAATGYRAQGSWQHYAGTGRERHPVVAVTWNDAVAFAEWAGKRLPTEAEWEVAARGGLPNAVYPSGERIGPDDATYGLAFADEAARTTPVGSHRPNPFGLYDMAGNVWEWCADYYAADYYSRSEGYDPKGPDRGAARVVRGGSWNERPEELRVTNRAQMTPTMIGPVFGFRCAKSP